MDNLTGGSPRSILRRIPWPAVCLLLLASTALLQGQARPPSRGIKGRVIDALTKNPLEGARISLVETSGTAKTDAAGEFKLSGLPAGAYTIEAALAGYEKLRKKNLVVPGEGDLTVILELVPVVPRITEFVTVVDRALESAPSRPGTLAKYNAEDILKMPGSVGDVSRALKSVPGISQVSDLSNDLAVRGGSPWENGFYVENIPVPDINHFQRQGGTGGLVSVLDAALMKDVRFFTGGFSAAYGDRMSSVVDIRLREGSRKGLRAGLDLSDVGFGGRIEGPLFGTKGALILSARRNYHDLIAKAIGIGVAPRFGDIHLKFDVQPHPRHRLTVLNIFGDSRLSYDLTDALNESLFNYGDYRARQNTFGLNWFFAWGPKGFSQTSLSHSFFKTDCSLRHINEAFSYYVIEENTSAVHLRNVNAWKLSKAVDLEFGLEMTLEQANFNNSFAKHMTRWEEVVPAYVSRGTHQDEKGGIFVSFSRRLSERWTATLGARADYYSSPARVHLAPRLSSSFEIASGWILNASFGIYYQTLPWFLLAGNPENRTAKDPSAFHSILGLRHDISGRTRLTLDVFYKGYRRLPLTPEDPALLVIDSGVDFELFRSFEVLASRGRAFTAGIEFGLQRASETGLSYFLSASLFRSRYEDFEGLWRNRLYDNRYLGAAVASYRPNPKWEVSLRWTVAGGVPYTPFDKEKSRDYNLGIVDRTRINEERYPSYHALDVRFDRRFAFKKSRLDLYVSVLNLYNRKNINRYYWNRIDNLQATTYQAPFLPIVGITYAF